jgi:hypothetical protein
MWFVRRLRVPGLRDYRLSDDFICSVGKPTQHFEMRLVFIARADFHLHSIGLGRTEVKQSALFEQCDDAFTSGFALNEGRNIVVEPVGTSADKAAGSLVVANATCSEELAAAFWSFVWTTVRGRSISGMLLELGVHGTIIASKTDGRFRNTICEHEVPLVTLPAGEQRGTTTRCMLRRGAVAAGWTPELLHVGGTNRNWTLVGTAGSALYGSTQGNPSSLVMDWKSCTRIAFYVPPTVSRGNPFVNRMC